MQSQESDASIETVESRESLDEEQVLSFSKEQPIDLTMQSAPSFKLYVKVILQFLDNKQIALTTLIHTGAISSIIHGSCLPKGYHIPTQVSFAATSGDQFYSHKYTKPIELLLLVKGIVCLLMIPQEKICCLEQIFLALLPFFTFHPEGFGYMITSLIDQKPHFLNPLG